MPSRFDQSTVVDTPSVVSILRRGQNDAISLHFLSFTTAVYVCMCLVSFMFRVLVLESFRLDLVYKHVSARPAMQCTLQALHLHMNTL